MTNSRILVITFFFIAHIACGYAQAKLQDTLPYFHSDTAKLNFIAKEINTLVYTNPGQCLSFVDTYDSIATKVSDSMFHTLGWVLRGMANYVNSNYDESIENYIQALSLKEYYESPSKIAQIYNNLATTYQVREDLDNSIKYFQQALDIYKQEGDSLWIANTSGNLGLLMLNNKKIEEAEPLISIALDYYVEKGHKIYEGYTRLNLANLLVEKKEYRKAIELYNKAIELVPENASPIVSLAAHSGIGVAYSRLNNFNQAEIFLNIGLKKSLSLNYQEQVIVCHEELAMLYEKNKQYQSALEHQKQYSIIKDSVFTKEQDDKMIEALTKYESDIKEQKIALLNAEQEAAEAKLQGSNNLLCALGFGLLILSGLLYWLYKLNSANKKAAKEKDTLLREIHHRVKNNLQVISALLTLQTKYVKEDTAIEALREGQDRVQSMALIHKDLYQHDNLKGVNTKDYLEALIQNLLASYNINENNIKLYSNIESLWLDVDTMIPMGLMINELISNSLKHAFTKTKEGELKIVLKEINEELLLTVSDNGPGIADLSNSTKGGFGKSLIDSFSKKLNADLSYNNDNGLSITMKIKDYKKAA